MELPVIQPGELNRRPPQTPIFQKVGIVGLGLIGGSIALAARQIWPASLVIGVDNKDVLETRCDCTRSSCRRRPVHPCRSGSGDSRGARGQNIELLRDLDDYVTQPAVVTDVGSTKRAIVDAARGLPPKFMFIGGHPLGGAANGGLEHARPDLFTGRPWLLTPPRASPAGDAVEKLLAFVKALGAEPRVLDVAAHDRLLAFLSHLPQLTASALMNVVGNAVGAQGLALSGKGLADTTRLASSPPEIWRDITATNADEIGPALDALIAVLEDLRRDLPNGDQLAEVFAEAARWRSTLKP